MRVINGRRLFELTEEFLKANKVGDSDSNWQSELNDKLRPENTLGADCDISDVWKRMVSSLSNAERRKKVIGEPDLLHSVHCHYSSKEFLKKYDGDTNNSSLLNDLEKAKNEAQRADRKKEITISREKRGIWPQYAMGLVSSAKYLERFSDGNDFLNWAGRFTNDIKMSAGLPLIISSEVHGLGFALACDFLKEIGFEIFAKPDVQIRSVLVATGHIEKSTSDYHVLGIMQCLAGEAGKRPFVLDKALWFATAKDDYWFTEEEKERMRVDGGKKNLFLSYLKEQGVEIR